jgi:N-acetyl sugar amidotransferase
MRYCKKCLEPDTRPDSIFDEEGICFPCRYAERIHEIDWHGRRRELDEIVAWGRARNVSGYDCIIPVSGGKDSHRQAIFARDELGLNPLLVSCTYPPKQQTHRGAHNLANLISLGFDCFYISPAPETWKQLMKVGFLKFGNMFKSTELALYASGPKIATLYHIPLVFYGENPALSWGSAGGSLDGNANRMKYSNTLKGGDLTPYLEDGYKPEDIHWHQYPSDEDIDRAQLRIVYLGYYMSDFNDFENARISIENGLECRTGEDAVLEDIGQLTTFDALDDDFVMVNQMLKYIKFGFGKASEQCSGAVRAGQMTREEAVELAERLDGKCADRYIHRFCDFIGISEDEFWDVAERYRGKDVWERKGNAWKLKVPLR